MNDAGFGISGWLLTGGVLLGYLVRLELRSRRITKSLDSDTPSDGGA